MDFSYEIKKHLGVISTNPKGWTTELNLISWNGRVPKYDLRSWDPDHEKMSKGIGLTREEILALRKLLNQEDIGEETV